MDTLYNFTKAFFEISKTGDNPLDSDLFCLEKALKQFLETGSKEDAFTVYFCYGEIFKLFGNGYENIKNILEMLSDHEYHSGELLSKHRDHYSHSVYVFAIGLAIFANDEGFKEQFLTFYKLSDDNTSSYLFLKLWGMTSLFHDVGYPFQLAYEQIKNYVEDVFGKDDKDNLRNPFVSFGNFLNFISINEDAKAKIIFAFPEIDKVETYNDLLAYGLKINEGYDANEVSKKLLERVLNQPSFLDHGYFSAIILAKQLFNYDHFVIDKYSLDVLTAILLHNNFNKYDAPNHHPLSLNEHPLAYLLIICDELQCWDRLAYGKISKQDPLAWNIMLDIKRDYLMVDYIFDSYVVRTTQNDEIFENKNYVAFKNQTFLEKIFGSIKVRGSKYVEDATLYNLQEPDKNKKIKIYEGYVVSPLTIKIKTHEQTKCRRTNLYASDDSFVSLYDLAKAIHASYTEHCQNLNEQALNEDFASLPLEFKISNIEQAKSYAKKLELINCFYSQKELDYPQVNDFNHMEDSEYVDNIGFLAREEHVRWVKEKLAMGWSYGTDYQSIEERNQKKIHKSIVPYELLPAKERSKDESIIKNMPLILKNFDSNIKIYNYRLGRKPTLEIAGVGHRFIKDDKEKLKNKVKAILQLYTKKYNVVVRTCFAYGADQLIAECAIELGLPLKANLPMPFEDFINDVRKDVESKGLVFSSQDELKMRHLLAQTVVCRIIEDPENIYACASEYIIRKCQVLIALWDGVKLPFVDENNNHVNLGGTYHCITMAKKANKDVKIVECYR